MNTLSHPRPPVRTILIGLMLAIPLTTMVAALVVTSGHRARGVGAVARSTEAPAEVQAVTA